MQAVLRLTVSISGTLLPTCEKCHDPLPAVDAVGCISRLRPVLQHLQCGAAEVSGSVG